jgi:hypothetical protein
MKLTLKEWLDRNGYSAVEEALAEYSELDAVYPALCTEDCQVEPDGTLPTRRPLSAPGRRFDLRGAKPMQPKFDLGQVVATPAALKALVTNNQTPLEFLSRHVTGDWGELDEHDQRENEYALAHGLRLLSAYTLRDATRLWIITEADRSATTLLLPSEY